MSRMPTKGIDYTSRDYEAFRELLIQKLQEKMPEYTDISETDAGIVILEALANGLDILSLYADVVANDVVLPTTQDRALAVVLARCLGYTPYDQSAAEYPQVFVLSKALEQKSLIPKGTRLATKESSDLATLKFETMEDLVIPAGKLGNEKDENGKYLYTVTVAQGETVKNDIIGSSNGTPSQSFKLSYTNVLPDTIKITVKEIDGDVTWERVDNLLESKGDSRVFLTSVDEFNVCTVMFGNGVRGMIPPSDFLNNISATYRIGGGEAGNIGENLITELKSGIPYVASTFNLEASKKGYEKEEIDSIKQNAPSAFRTRDRLVTLEDYEDLVRLNFQPRVLAVKAIRDSNDKRLAHLYLMPRDIGDLKIIQDLEEEITEFISMRSMIGTDVQMHDYSQQPIDINGKLYVDHDYDLEEVLADVKMYLEGVTFAYGNNLFGDTIVKPSIEAEVIKTFDGVLSFRISEPTEDIIKPQNPQSVLTCGSIDIEAVYPT